MPIRRVPGIFAAAFLACQAALVVACAQGCATEPRTAADVLARSVTAHGGDRLTTWKTLTIAGRVRMQDGITYNAAYLLQAKAPGRLRVEQDMTADRGRMFYEYFLNDGVAWSRRNLVPGPVERERMARWLDQCSGIAFYTGARGPLELKPDAQVAWEPPPAVWTDTAAATRPAWVIGVKIGEESRELFIDKETFYFLKEVTPTVTRIYWDPRRFSGVVMPTHILEMTKNRQGETQTPITYERVTFNGPIEDWVFREDMPAGATR
jgi:hypothetical protein